MNESQFKQKVLSCLRKQGWFCQNLESRQTGVGIPDTFIMRGGTRTFIEFKYDNKPYVSLSKVGWRPGQKSWALQYYMASGMKDTTYTVLGCKDKIVVIKMSRAVCIASTDDFRAYLGDYAIVNTIAEIQNCII